MPTTPFFLFISAPLTFISAPLFSPKKNSSPSSDYSHTGLVMRKQKFA
jgi:hypothetical protein